MNFARYEKDVERLTNQGGKLVLAMDKQIGNAREVTTDFPPEALKNLPDVSSEYETWYSEALALISQLLPDRVEDFKSYYKSKISRKKIDHSNYTVSDYLRGLQISMAGSVIVDPSAAINPMYQQYNIIKGLGVRLRSTLFDIKTLVHADLLDDELHAAEELNRKGFQRGAGAIAGVVLEAHLGIVCERHRSSPKKKNPTLSDLYNALKSADIIDTAKWRYIQHLGDLRNKCDHKKDADPTKAEVGELIDGVRKITKTVF